MLHDEVDVYVELAGRPVQAGRLGASFSSGRQLGGSWFQYDADFWKAAGAYPLDPRLPRSASRSFSGGDRALFSAFQDLAPDDWGRMIIDANIAHARKSGAVGPGPIGELDYLTLSGDESRLGSIRFSSERAGWLGPAQVGELSERGLDAYAAAAGRFEAHEATEEDLELLGAPGTSAGGARPKVTVYVNGELRMVKLPSSRDKNRDGEAWEHVAMQIAQNAGICVQQGELLRTSDGKSSLSVKRFDRGPGGKRYGYMSARTAMELGDQDQGSISYQEFADTVDRVTGNSRGELRDLFKRVALTVLINNTDDHWKNHGFLHGSRGWTLSPAFDVNPSLTRGVINSRPICDSDDPRQRDIRNLADTASSYALSSAEAGAALGEVLTAVQAWPDRAREAGIASGEIATMSAAFSEEQQELTQQRIERLTSRTPSIDLTAQTVPPVTSSEQRGGGGGGNVWVQPHMRRGRHVEGFWRRPGKR